MSEQGLDPLGLGIQAGLGRIERHQLAMDSDALDAAMSITAALLRRPDVEASPRFVELFGEIVVVAVSARSSYGEAPLTEDDIHRYLLDSFVFLNSFRHA